MTRWIMSELGQSQRGRASNKSGYVRCALKAEIQTIGIRRNGPLRGDDATPARGLESRGRFAFQVR
jgi:hypothetical protein